MASMKPGIFQPAIPDDLQDFSSSLLSMENLDRTSPELWPEDISEINEVINSLKSPPSTSNKLPYSKKFTREDENKMHELASLSSSALIGKIKELQDMAYQLGVEESKEVTRGKYLNIFNKRKSK